MSDKRDRRRLRGQINRFGHAPEPKRSSNPQAHILAGLNVVQSLEEAANQYIEDLLWHGPGSFTGHGWASMVIWLREKGYNTHHNLTLFGVWVVQKEDGEELLVGTRQLPYSAAIYNAESYNHLIQRDFTTYYGAGLPPEVDDVILRVAWSIERRLALREELRTAFVQHLRLTTR
ncbi:MAG: hypothetical protein KC496_06745 [Anaerolineae bacterium]|nr:hypothetical protein [Anaerolineae bacterium]